jgi:hypothetical protein
MSRIRFDGSALRSALSAPARGTPRLACQANAARSSEPAVTRRSSPPLITVDSPGRLPSYLVHPTSRHAFRQREQRCRRKSSFECLSDVRPVEELDCVVATASAVVVMLPVKRRLMSGGASTLNRVTAIQSVPGGHSACRSGGSSAAAVAKPFEGVARDILGAHGCRRRGARAISRRCRRPRPSPRRRVLFRRAARAPLTRVPAASSGPTPP